MATKLNENSEVALPLRNILSMIAAAAVATWGYFGIVERLNQIETNQKLMHNDVIKNTEFRIKWPRGEMGSLPADSEQFMLLEHLAGELECKKSMVSYIPLNFWRTNHGRTRYVYSSGTS